MDYINTEKVHFTEDEEEIFLKTYPLPGFVMNQLGEVIFFDDEKSMIEIITEGINPINAH